MPSIKKMRDRLARQQALIDHLARMNDDQIGADPKRALTPLVNAILWARTLSDERPAGPTAADRVVMDNIKASRTPFHDAWSKLHGDK